MPAGRSAEVVRDGGRRPDVSVAERPAAAGRGRVRSAVVEPGVCRVRAAERGPGGDWGVRSAGVGPGGDWGVRPAAGGPGGDWGVRSAGVGPGGDWGVRSAWGGAGR